MDNWLIFLGGMAICCAILAPLAALTDWMQRKLDEFNEQQDNEQLNNAEQ
jgi:hypothetical protein